MDHNQIMEKYCPVPAYMNKMSGEIIDAAIKVHSIMGKSLPEIAYEESLALELRSRGLSVERQVAVPLDYEENKIASSLRIDILVEDCVIVEIKAVKELNDSHEGQLLAYLDKAEKRLGLVINFGGDMIKGNIMRRIM